MSNIVNKAPSTTSSGFKCFLTKLMVFNNCPNPSNAYYSHCTGINTLSEAVKAFKVTKPKEGGQSIIT